MKKFMTAIQDVSIDKDKKKVCYKFQNFDTYTFGINKFALVACGNIYKVFVNIYIFQCLCI